MSSSGATLYTALLDSANDRPSHAALEEGECRLDYQQLVQRAERLALLLLESGLKRGDRVLLFLAGGIPASIAIEACFAAGLVIVPFCPELKARSLREVLERCTARAVVFDAARQRVVHEALRDLSHPLVLLRTGREAPLAELPSAIDIDPVLAGKDSLAKLRSLTPPSPEDLAALCFTSGSTGKPKGVMLTHGMLRANAEAIVPSLGLSELERVGLGLPLYYAYGSSVLQTHLLVGATVCFLPSMVFPQAVLDALASKECTGFPVVPSTLARLLPLLERSPRVFPLLRYLSTAGAALPRALGTRTLAAFPGKQLYVMYGQTEASARLTCLPAHDYARKPLSCGKALRGIALEARDDSGASVGPGETGEIIARGESIMRGYWEDPDSTREALAGGVLHTGDIGRIDAEGFVFLEGRSRELIKSGGHRISPLEIEDRLLEHESVQEAAVLGLDDEVLGERIVACVVTEGARPIAERELQAHCARTLPRFKLPSEIRVVASLPRSANGKLQRMRLRQHFEA